MKKVVLIIVTLIIGGYFINSYIDKEAKRAAEQAKAERIELATKAALSKMASRTNAIDDWEEQLSKGKRFQFESILTLELEKLWLQQRPILFVGVIKDIATHNQSDYVVLVEKSPFGSFEYMLGTELQLSLIASKDQIDRLLKKHPDLIQNHGFKNNVAVVARINSIKSTYLPGEDGEHKEAKIGEGELIDILYMEG